MSETEVKKRCSCCKQKKSICEFNKCKRNKDGLQSLCKNCIHHHYLKCRDEISLRGKQHYEEHREEILSKHKMNRLKEGLAHKEELKKNIEQYNSECKEKIKNLIGLDKEPKEICRILNMSRSTLHRRVKQYNLILPVYIQSEKTKKIRRDVMKKAKLLDPTIKEKQIAALVKYNTFIKGKTYEEIYKDPNIVQLLKKRSRLVNLGKKMPESQKLKIKNSSLGRIISMESRNKMSKTRKELFRTGKLKLSPRVGSGKGGFKQDIGHYIRSTYEHYYAQQLIKDGIKYLYEPQSFQITVDNVEMQYTPDFYIEKENKWIEIKNPYNVRDELFNKKLQAFKNQYENETIDVIVGNRKWVPT